MDLQAFSDVASRLAPLRRMLDDIIEAAELMRAMAGERSERFAELTDLRYQVSTVQDQLQLLELSRQEKQKQVEEETLYLSNRLAEQRALHEAYIAEASAARKRVEFDLEQLQAMRQALREQLAAIA